MGDKITFEGQNNLAVSLLKNAQQFCESLALQVRLKICREKKIVCQFYQDRAFLIKYLASN
jgi:hypothetical protein